jgi:two-component sensor histidine kinase
MHGGPSHRAGAFYWAIKTHFISSVEEGLKTMLCMHRDCLAVTRRTEEQVRLVMREKEVLVREIHHRVKNNLQIISSLLNLQASYVKDMAALEALRESQNRVRAMAIVHEQLHKARNYSSINFPEYVASLTTNLFRSYGVDAKVVRLELDIEPVKLMIDTAISCGLIIHELVSNSLKHAFPGGRKGTIGIHLRSEAGSFQLTMRDNGVGFSRSGGGGRKRSLGLRLVDILAEQIGGMMRRKRTNQVTEYTVRFCETRHKESA